jgi:hypothetical protein
MRDRLQPRSQRPPAFVDPDAHANASVGGVASAENARRLSPAERVAQLLAIFVIALDSEELAFLTGLLSAAAAVKLGADKNAAEVFDELVSALTTYAPYIHAGSIPGYGARRGRFAVECLRKVAPSLDAHAARDVDSRLATKKAARTVEPADAAYRQHVRTLSRLLDGDPDARDRLDEMAAEDQSTDAKLDALDQLVPEIARARATIPTTLLDEAGLTAEVLDALPGMVDAAVRARQSARKARSARQHLRAELVPQVGRMFYELRYLLTSVRDARKKNPTLPRFQSKFVGRGGKRAPEGPTEPPK